MSWAMTIALIVLAMVVGYGIRHVQDSVVYWISETTAVIRRWTEVLLLVVGIIFVFYAAIRWGVPHLHAPAATPHPSPSPTRPMVHHRP